MHLSKKKLCCEAVFPWAERLTVLKHQARPIQPLWPMHSRVHPIPPPHRRKASAAQPKQQWFLKREDELGGLAASGTKLRKLNSLIPLLQARGIEEVYVIASLYANQLLACLATLPTCGLRVKPVLLGPAPSEPRGNGFLNQLLLPNVSPDLSQNTLQGATFPEILWIPRQHWQDAATIARKYAQHAQPPIPAGGSTSSPLGEPPYFVLPEGGFCAEALPGALSLAADILAEEQPYDHIVIDAGTGLSAGALILGLAWAQTNTHVHVVQVAGQKGDFNKALLAMLSYLESPRVGGKNLSLDSLQERFSLHQPPQGRSFGSCPNSTVQAITRTAASSGVLSDPVYMGKVFDCLHSSAWAWQLEGRILVIHSGGTSSLFGFQHRFFPSEK